MRSQAGNFPEIKAESKAVSPLFGGVEMVFFDVNPFGPIWPVNQGIPYYWNFPGHGFMFIKCNLISREHLPELAICVLFQETSALNK